MILVIANFPSINAENESIGIRGDTVTIRAILLQNGTYGVPVSNQAIEFYDQTMNTFLNYGITNDDGIASIIWNIPESYPLGPTIINATYRGNESLFLAPSCQWVTINILSLTTITVHNSQEVLAPGDYVSFDIQIVDDSLTPIVDAPVSIYCNNMLLATAQTNSSGGIFFFFQCNATWSNIGDNVIHVIYEQDLVHYYSRAEELFNIRVQKLDTQVSIDSFSDQGILGDEFSTDIYLNSTEGGMSANLVVFLDEYSLANITTDSSGHFRFTTEIDSRFSLGSHTLQVMYDGNERYSESLLYKQFDVFSFVNIKYDAETPAVINSSIEFNIEVTDTLNRPISGILFLSDLTNGFNTSIHIPIDSSNFAISLTISNPLGMHNLQISLDNQFVLNGTLLYPLIVWNLPTIEIIEINVFHYASPAQEIKLQVHLSDSFENISYRDIDLLLDNNIIHSFQTKEDGIAILTTYAPINEGIYNYSILCPKNIDQFELSARLDYQLIVAKQIPAMVNLAHCEVIPPLQIVRVKLQVVCLNGSLLNGILVKFDWLSMNKYQVTQENGTIIMQLSLPSTSGNFSLNYEIQSTNNLAYSSGAINLSISRISILSAQGIGIGGFAVTFIVSSVLFAIPIIRQRLNL